MKVEFLSTKGNSAWGAVTLGMVQGRSSRVIESKDHNFIGQCPKFLFLILWVIYFSIRPLGYLVQLLRKEDDRYRYLLEEDRVFLFVYFLMYPKHLGECLATSGV